MARDRVAQLADGNLPLRLRIVDIVGQRQRTPDAVVDAGVSGQQGFGFWAGWASGPGDFTTLELQVHHEVDRLGDDGPHGFGEAPVAGDQDVVPDPGGDVGAEVAVAVGVFDDAVAQLDGPGPVGPLNSAAPVERATRRFQQTCGGERHRILDVIPWIGVATVEPRDGAGRFLCRGDRLRGLAALCGGQNAAHCGHVIERQPAPPPS